MKDHPQHNKEPTRGNQGPMQPNEQINKKKDGNIGLAKRFVQPMNKRRQAKHLEKYVSHKEPLNKS